MKTKESKQITHKIQLWKSKCIHTFISEIKTLVAKGMSRINEQ